MYQRHARELVASYLSIENLILYAFVTVFSLFASVAFGETNSAPAANSSLDAVTSRPPMVVQNRFFRKALRPEVSAVGGVLLNEAYSKTYGMSIRTGLFFNEYLGMEFGYTSFSSSNSADLDALSRLVYYKKDQSPTHIEPSFVRLNSAASGHLVFAPIYGKINFLDYAIIYSDLYFSAGTGMLKTTGGNEVPGILGIGQRFFFGKKYSVRVDGWDHIFTETRENNGEKLQSTRHAWLVTLGMGVFLWGGDQ